MGLDVFGEVIASNEPLAADGTGEALLAGVGAEVPLEFITPREALAAK